MVFFFFFFPPSSQRFAQIRENEGLFLLRFVVLLRASFDERSLVRSPELHPGMRLAITGMSPLP